MPNLRLFHAFSEDEFKSSFQDDKVDSSAFNRSLSAVLAKKWKVRAL